MKEKKSEEEELRGPDRMGNKRILYIHNEKKKYSKNNIGRNDHKE